MQSNVSSLSQNEDSQVLLSSGNWKDEDKYETVTLFIGSWNMHGKATPSESIDCFLPVGEFDMYVVGTQECERSIEASVVMPSDKSEWESKVRDTMGPDYEMVARYISLFGLRFTLGAYHDNVAARNEDFHRINQNLFQNANNLNIFGAESITKVPATESFDRVFWFGDLNYRINGDRSTVEKLILSSRLDLLKAKKKGQIFKDFVEAPISFPPTYKFDTGTDLYDTSAKGRIPAWTDRVLYKKSGYIKLLEYNSVPKLSFSDHKPVYASFEVKYSVDGEHHEMHRTACLR